MSEAIHADPISQAPQSSRHYDVIVLGAGAAGLMCALTAAQRGRRVLILEKSNNVGKKILMSGGGRCNFTNDSVDAENFISGNPHFCKSALKRFTQWDFISLVEKHGIAFEERKHGQFFCLHSAKDILDMLLRECEEAGVKIMTHCESSIEALAGGFNLSNYQLRVSQGNSGQRESCQISCESLVIACGALSIPTLGGSGAGYDIARQFALPLTELRAGLVPFMFTDALKPICERLSGLAIGVEVSCNSQSFTENLLFTHRGISGPAILQISNYWHPGDEIQINLLPEVNAMDWLLELKAREGKSLLKNAMRHKLAKTLLIELQTMWWPELATIPLAECSDTSLGAIGSRLNAWHLKPSATEGYRTAEVTLGGVSTDAISSKTMESRQQPRLYFVGEVLDVTGQLGGYNFQWAWSSGHCAGLVA